MKRTFRRKRTFRYKRKGARFVGKSRFRRKQTYDGIVKITCEL